MGYAINIEYGNQSFFNAPNSRIFFCHTRLKRTTIDDDDVFAHVYENPQDIRRFFTFPIRLFQNSLRSRCARKQRVAIIGIWVPTTILSSPFRSNDDNG